MTDHTDRPTSNGFNTRVFGWWACRLVYVAAMLILAYWLSRTGDAFFYQGF